MPLFDTTCRGCGAEAEKFAHRVDALEPCIGCGAPVERVLRPSRVNVQADDVPGGFWVENMSATPMHFSSKSEHRAAMQRLGLRSHVKHQGTPGSDRSPHTSRWV